MKKFKVLLATLSACSLFAFSGCKPTDNKENVITDPQYDIYKLAQGSGYEGTYEEWLKSIAGDAIVLKVENNRLMWKYSKEDDALYKFLIDFSSIEGAKGEDGKNGIDGVSVLKIEKTSSNENVDTYTITYSNNTTSTFTVTNGVDGQSIKGDTGADGHTPVITVGENCNWFVDGKDTNTKAQGEKGDTGADGVSVLKIEKTSSNENVDTYTIYYSNDKTSTFTVTNGVDGQSIKGDTGEDGHTPVITVGENGNWFVDGKDTNTKAQGEKGEDGKNGADGVSVLKIEKTSSEDNVDTYTIYYSNDTTSTFIVTNGVDGQSIKGDTGADGHTPVITIGDNGNWFIDDVDTNQPVVYNPINTNIDEDAKGLVLLPVSGIGYEVVSYLGTSSNVVIPDTYLDAPIVSIAKGAFENNTTIETVVIGSNVKNIGYDLFKNCTNLEVIYYNGLYWNDGDFEDKLVDSLPFETKVYLLDTKGTTDYNSKTYTERQRCLINFYSVVNCGEVEELFTKKVFEENAFYNESLFYKDGYAISGYYLSESLGERYDITTPITNDLNIYVKYESNEYIQMANSNTKVFAYDFDDNTVIDDYDHTDLTTLPYYFKSAADAGITVENGTVTIDSKELRFMFGDTQDYNLSYKTYYDSGVIRLYTEMSFDKVKTEERFLSFGGNSYVRFDNEAFALRVGANGNFVYRFDGGLDQDLGLQVYKNYLYKILVTYDLSEQKLNISINGQEVLRDKVLTATSLKNITISSKNDAGISTKKVYNIALTYEEKPTSDLRDRKVELLTSMEDGYKNAYITPGREDELYINTMNSLKNDLYDASDLAIVEKLYEKWEAFLATDKHIVSIVPKTNKDTDLENELGRKTVAVTDNNKADLTSVEFTGYNIVKYYTDEELTTAFKSYTKIKTDMVIYAKVEAKEAVSETIVFNDLPGGNITSTIKLGSYITIYATQDTLWSIDDNTKQYIDVDDNEQTATKRLKSTASRNNMVLDLSTLSGKEVTLELFAITGTGGQVRYVTIRDYETLKDLYIRNVRDSNNPPAEKSETYDGTNPLVFKLEGGKKYIIYTSAAINFSAINIKFDSSNANVEENEITKGLVLSQITGMGYQVTGYLGTDTTVIIPNEYNGEPILSMTSNAIKDIKLRAQNIVINKNLIDLPADEIYKIDNVYFNLTKAELNNQPYGSELIIDGGLYVLSESGQIEFENQNYNRLALTLTVHQIFDGIDEKIENVYFSEEGYDFSIDNFAVENYYVSNIYSSEEIDDENIIQAPTKITDDTTIYIKYESKEYREFGKNLNTVNKYNFDANPTFANISYGVNAEALQASDSSIVFTKNGALIVGDYTNATTTAEPIFRYLFNNHVKTNGIFKFYTEMSFDNIRADEAFIGFIGDCIVQESWEIISLDVDANGKFAYRIYGNKYVHTDVTVLKDTLYKILFEIDLSSMTLNITINGEKYATDELITATFIESVRLKAKKDGSSPKKVYNLAYSWEEKEYDTVTQSKINLYNSINNYLNSSEFMSKDILVQQFITDEATKIKKQLAVTETVATELQTRWNCVVNTTKYEVTFDARDLNNTAYNGHYSLIVLSGEAADLAKVVFNSYEILGFYSDYELQTVYDSTAPITDNITIYVKVTPVVLNNSISYTPKTYEEGDDWVTNAVYKYIADNSGSTTQMNVIQITNKVDATTLTYEKFSSNTKNIKINVEGWTTSTSKNAEIVIINIYNKTGEIIETLKLTTTGNKTNGDFTLNGQKDIYVSTNEDIGKIEFAASADAHYYISSIEIDC